MTSMSRQQLDTPLRAAQSSGTGMDEPPGALVVRHLRSIEDALVDRSIEFAKSNGYAPYTTTIRAAWTEAIRSLTEALETYLLDPRAEPRGPLATIEYRCDPRFAGMRMIARKHRAVGITLELYLGLFKHFRRVYTDVLVQSAADPEMRAQLLDRVIDFFDETELSITADWNEAGGDHRLRELQVRTRSLTLAKDRYVAIFETLRNPAFLLDHARRLVHANQVALDLFLGAGEAGDGLYLSGRNDLRARLEHMLGDLFAPGAELDPVIWIETMSGRRCFDLRLRSLHDSVENNPLGHLLQLYDVTAYREATDQAQRAERQMSRFLAMMSHEIRTPLHSVLGAAELLRMADDRAQPVYLDVIKSAGQSLLQTLNNVLDYSKMEHGPPVPRPAAIALAPALRGFCDMLAAGPEAHRARLSLRVAPDVPSCARIDWAMIQQVLTNLVSNALRHDSGAGVVLLVDVVERNDRATTQLRFSVTDHGPGLPAEEAAVLFRPFEEAQARPTVEGGAGLGLAISRYLVRAMGGHIDFCNSDRGTRIWFEIPCEPASEVPAATERAAMAFMPPGGRCLLVDDDPIGALVSARQIELAGFTVDHAATIGAARYIFGQGDYDAVVIDYLLPDGTGPELLECLRLSAQVGGAVFIALTANVEALNADPELRQGFHRVLAKPTDTARLAEALQVCAERVHTRTGADTGLPRPVALAAHVGASLDSIAGLSPATLAAMAEALRRQWSDFRKLLGAVRETRRFDDLQAVAHRLAGSAAQLGLSEFEGSLRELERRCDAGSTADLSDLSDLVARLDRPIEDAASWRRLARVEAVR